MSFKIGFTSTLYENENQNEIIEKAPQNALETVAKKSLVDVCFDERHITCSYYNDCFDLKCGDIVYVEGKLEGVRGRVVGVNYTFKIKLSDYKRVIAVADTTVKGKFFMLGTHFVTFDKDALPFEKVLTWFKAPTLDEEETVFSTDGVKANIHDLATFDVKNEVAQRALEYYKQNRVVYLEVKGDKGRAIVRGGKPYVVEFTFDGTEIGDVVCECFCSGICKHAFATMMQLRETVDLVEERYPDENNGRYFATVCKSEFFAYVVDSAQKGSFEVA